MCDCAGDASCVLRFCRAISLDAPKVADVRAAADCVEDLRGAAPDEVEAICAQWKVLAKGKFRRAVAALQAEVRQGADGPPELALGQHLPLGADGLDLVGRRSS